MLTLLVSATFSSFFAEAAPGIDDYSIADVPTNEYSKDEGFFYAGSKGKKVYSRWVVGGINTLAPGGKISIDKSLPKNDFEAGYLSPTLSAFEVTMGKINKCESTTLILTPKDSNGNSVRLNDYVYGLYFETPNALYTQLELGDIHENTNNGLTTYRSKVIGRQQGDYYIYAEFYGQKLGKTLEIKVVNSAKIECQNVNGELNVAGTSLTPTLPAHYIPDK